MNEISIFSFQGNAVRAATIDGEPWFCLSDVCAVLDVGNASQLKTRLNQDGVFTNEVIDALGRAQVATFINEQNLYKTIFQSRKPEAEQFTDWVTGEVLPAIRKNGGYLASNPNEPPEVTMAKAIKIAESTIARNEARLAEANNRIAELAPSAKYADTVLSFDHLHTVNPIAVHLGYSNPNDAMNRHCKGIAKRYPLFAAGGQQEFHAQEVVTSEALSARSEKY